MLDHKVKLLKDKNKEAENKLVISYMALRSLIELAGMILPFLLIRFVDCLGKYHKIKPTISDHYFTSSRDFFCCFAQYTWRISAYLPRL